MRVLIIQTSPFGDIVETLPALTDAKRANPNIVFDWVVEESYQEIPSWHPVVSRVIPAATRRWRKNFWRTLHSPEWRQFKFRLREKAYDLVIDCQGLVKSALLGRLAKAPVIGLSKSCVRESLSCWFYQRQHAIDASLPKAQAIRALFAQALDYNLAQTELDYGIDANQFSSSHHEPNNVLLIHNASRAEKLYPEDQWAEVITQLTQKGLRVRLPWSKKSEKLRAERLASSNNNVEVLPRLNLRGLACVIKQANAVVSVDTGLSHLSVVLGVPTVTVYNFPTVGDSGSENRLCENLYPDSVENKQKATQQGVIVEPSVIADAVCHRLPKQSIEREAG